MAVEDKKETQKVSFKDTLNLPKTDFPIRANAKELDPEMLKRWEEEKLYEKAFLAHKGAEKYILHDGPPYANGPIHLGTAYNKILKDFVTKSQRMSGKQVPVTPGWDCHGLPIERNVSKEHPGLSPVELIKKCREYAYKWIDIQRDQFKQLGVVMNWAHPYLTMDYGYESSILKALGILVEKNFIERKFKTVPWCASCQTSLASAEIEYKERKDPSVYVLFPLHTEYVAKFAPELKDKKVHLLIWTTTPWTLPLNRAVTLRPATSYVIADAEGIFVILAKTLLEKVAKDTGKECKVLLEINSDQLKGASVEQPLTGLSVPIIFDEHVALDEGTACVHTAPGCGPEDYELALKNSLEIYSPLTSDGKYDQTITPADLTGVLVTDGQWAVLKKLEEQGWLFYKGSIRHPYPHCWRCRNGLIFRATKQWFLDLRNEQLQDKTIKALEHVNFLPKQSANHLRAAIESRLEWCISRQRVCGAPIPALICEQCDVAYLKKDLIDAIASKVAEHGIVYWREVSIEQLMQSHNVKCPSCGSSHLRKETDILDVWFDAGVSHFAVLKQNKALAYPANMYLEGRDQARGWFQASLLTSMAIEGEPSTKTILTHGYTADETGEKMSKSIGNVVAPIDIINQFGTDILRLWVSSIDYTDDAIVSDALLKNVQEVYRKVRNTARFLLSNLYDFNIDKDAVALEKLLSIDQYALRSLYFLNQDVRKAYEKSDFTAIFHRLTDYCTTELSSLYLDIIKDRLYVEKADGHARRSAQTVCWHILDAMTKLMAPIFSFVAEQISDYYQRNKKESIHLQKFAEVQNIWRIMVDRSELKEHFMIDQSGLPLDNRRAFDLDKMFYQWDVQWQKLFDVRSAVLKAIEKQREQGVIKHSLESRILISFEGELLKELQPLFERIEKSGQSLMDFLREFFIVSQVLMQPSGLRGDDNGLKVDVERAQGEKCPRCWQYDTAPERDNLCRRCYKIVEK
ncbi:TPA: isoleucine--tRNA ligase [Candidatus Dependentiae bacterium]|nr:MAG: Isoleucine-tRNA ligase [candidate division TM6 bacterium GW2011_GWF2_36_131]KKQ03216.1 MAG: Isoleucine-tRNA ligase [candidate division TM6 bacterium GW2011_GWE2_36_25]KKQ18998.1 MAG: Isoleucine-tRNA ligase [candidate division TM6 bacterium GW2011_GWA2_36_9]HBR70354.1 isoleucine--tRNA ligase [Candidatus Dependentiae bacterium]HCU00899.1 isoleucine--tRNA ligase [Candidatus Dependentiae bacterium]